MMGPQHQYFLCAKPTRDRSVKQRHLTRRTVVAGIGATVTMPWIARRGLVASKPILIGVPATSTAAIGAADHGDHISRTAIAVDEICAAGGVLGRPLAGRQQTGGRRMHRYAGGCNVESVYIAATSGNGCLLAVQMRVSPWLGKPRFVRSGDSRKPDS